MFCTAMGLRQQINDSPRLTAVITGCVVFLAALFILWQSFGARSRRSVEPRAVFCSDDDGGSYYVGIPTQAPPFNHHGKTAVIAQVFRCGEGGVPFVGFLWKYDDKTKAAIDESQKDPKHRRSPELITMSTPVLAKKPHDKKWVSNATASRKQFDAVVTPVCPAGGSGKVTPVRPSDPDNGAR